MTIKFHYTYFLVALGFILTGYFSNLIIFTSIIIIHELGHLIIAKRNNLAVKNIVIYPFGGLSQINIPNNTNITIELQVALAGVMFQTIYYFFIMLLYKNNLIREYIFNEFTIYNTNIFFFNLLPIYPLDGSKILTSILSKYFPYKLSLKLNVLISIITLIIIISLNIYRLNYTLFLILIIIIQNIIKYYNLIEYNFNKFLLERYLSPQIYLKVKKISHINEMYKEKYHLIKRKNEYISENKTLKERFDPKMQKIFD